MNGPPGRATAPPSSGEADDQERRRATRESRPADAVRQDADWRHHAWAADLNAEVAEARDARVREAEAAVEAARLAAVDEVRSRFLDSDTIAAIPPPEWLVDGWLTLNSLAMLYGPSGGGKSFLGIDLALHIATGSWWNGCRVESGPVVYVAAEGVAGIGRRVAAWKTHHKVYDLSGRHPVTWYPQAVNLADRSETELFGEAIRGLDPVLVVFDTLARCTLGAEENSARDMGLVVANLERIKRITEACILAVHHSGKDAGQGARGSSALRAAMDTELEIGATDDRHVLKGPKQKDSEEPAPMHLARLPVAESCVLVPSRLVPDDDESFTGKDVETLDVLRGMALTDGVSRTDWRDESVQKGIGRSTWFAARKRLVESGAVQNVGTKKQPRYVPADQDVSE